WPGGVTATLTVIDREGSGGGGANIGMTTLEFSTLAGGDGVELTGVPFDLESSHDGVVDGAVSPGELRAWFLGHFWQRLRLVQYGRSDSPGYADTDCVTDGSCMSVEVQRAGDTATVTLPGVRGVVLAVGSTLAGQARSWPPTSRRDYLEGHNWQNTATV